jgi:molecular chaperone GrpE
VSLKKKRREEPAPATEAPTEPAEGAALAETNPGAAPSADIEAEAGPGTAVVEPADQAALRLEREVAEWKDRALRAAADLENFRKRSYRDREEATARAQAEVLARVLEVVDDLARVAHLDPAQTSAEALHEGMALVERKFLKVLEAAGVERIDPAGQPFDPHSHEAVTTLPAPSAEADHTVGVVFQHGYRLRGALLRPARVAVYQWTAPREGDGGDGGASSDAAAN